MSSKKARRKKRREEEKQERRSSVNPAMVFILAIGVAVLVTVAVSMTLGGSSAPGDPPRPGAVWSEAHGHWH